jgi:hypothetical protein
VEHFGVANLLTVAIALLGVAASAGAMLWRMGRVEKDQEQLEKKLDERIRDFQHARERQGERIGELEWDVARLCERSGMAPSGRRRHATKPRGEELG